MTQYDSVILSKSLKVTSQISSSGWINLNFDILAANRAANLTNDISMDVDGANPAPLALPALALPGLSQQPWVDHRACLKKSRAENWIDLPNRKKLAKLTKLGDMNWNEATEIRPAIVGDLETWIVPNL